VSFSSINCLMEAEDLTAANKALAEGWSLISALSRADKIVYILGRHKETAQEAAIRTVNAEQAAEKAKAAKNLWP
jgi:hypothetical protein